MTDLSKLKPGDKFFYANVGYGLTSYERGDDVIGRRRGKLFTDTFCRIGMDWDEGRQTWVFDGGMGIRTHIVSGDDPRAIAECED